MALFDIMLKGRKLKVVKVQYKDTAVVMGFKYIKTITNSTKANALKQAQKELDSGMIKTEEELSRAKWNKESKERTQKKSKPVAKVEIKKSLPSQKTHDVKKAIFCDFNGVLDKPYHSVEILNTDSDRERVMKLADPEKLLRVLKLAIKHNADLVMTSLWRTIGLNYFPIIREVFSTSENEEYVNFYKDNEDTIIELTDTYTTDTSGNRTDQVRQLILDIEYTDFVVFEDEHEIDSELNPIMTNPQIGLLDRHIEDADLILSR